MVRRPPRSTPKPSSAASDVYKRQVSYLFVLIVDLKRVILSWYGKICVWHVREKLIIQTAYGACIAYGAPDQFFCSRRLASGARNEAGLAIQTDWMICGLSRTQAKLSRERVCMRLRLIKMPAHLRVQLTLQILLSEWPTQLGLSQAFNIPTLLLSLLIYNCCCRCCFCCSYSCLLYTSPSPRDGLLSRMPSSA